MPTDLLEADAIAVRETVRLVAGLTAEDLSRPTPCAGWDLGTLLTHMTVQHRGFAAAGADPGLWEMPAGGRFPDFVRADDASAFVRVYDASASARGHDASASARGHDASAFVRVYTASAELVLAAFAAPGVLDREFALPEISASRIFPGRVAIGFHLVDNVVHGWDVATALGVPFALPLPVLETTLPLARAVPDGPLRLAPGAAFAPALPVPADADPLTEILLRLGRKIVGGS
jgi:uncharacterized protein (TIGR03086 family)